MFKRTVYPLTAIAAVFSLSGCGGGDDGYLYISAEDCALAHPGKEEICQAAYDDAQLAAYESGPKYSSEALCEVEFGDDQCEQFGGTSLWVPIIAGFVVSEIIDEVGDYYKYKKRRKYYGNYYSTPVFLSSKRGKPVYFGIDHRKIGTPGQHKVALASSAYQKQVSKVVTSRTVSRGGFGATVRSSFSSSGRSWGG